MKRLITATALAGVLTAGSAFAQTLPTPPPAELGTEAGRNSAPLTPDESGPGAAPEANEEFDQRRMERRTERRADREMRWHSRASDDGDRRHQRHWRHGRHGSRGGDSGAQFRVRLGDDGSIRLNVKCAANEPMRACGDIMLQILDRLNTEPAGEMTQDQAPSQQ